MQDTLKLTQEAILKLIESSNQGLSDPVILAIIAACVTISTLITNTIVQAKVKKVEAVRAEAELKTASRFDEVDIKINGGLTQLLKEAQERGRLAGEKEEKDRKTNGGSAPNL